MEHLLKYSGWPVWLECFHDADGNGSHEEDTRKGQNSLGLKYMCFRIDKKMVLLIDELLLSTTCQQPRLHKHWPRNMVIVSTNSRITYFNWSYIGIYINYVKIEFLCLMSYKLGASIKMCCVSAIVISCPETATLALEVCMYPSLNMPEHSQIYS